VRHRKNAGSIVRNALSLYGEALRRLNLIEVLPCRGAGARKAPEGLATLMQRKT